MIVAVVKDGVATIESQKPASIFVTDINLPDKIYRNHEFPMTFTVENIGNAEFYSTITPTLIDSKGDVVSKSTFRPVDILIGEKDDIKDYIGKFSPLKEHTLAPGAYTMVFRDEAGKTVSDPIVVNLEVNDDKTEIKVTDLDVQDKEEITDPSKIKISFNVECVSGVYFGSLRFDVFPGDGGYEVCGSTSSDMYLGTDESKEVEMTADFSNLKDGWYMGAVYDGGKSMTGTIYFHIKKETVGVNSIESDAENTQIYDLNGIRHQNSTQPGFYIINGKKVMIGK